MTLLDGLRRANPGLALFDSCDSAFAPFGAALSGDYPTLLSAMELHAPIPDEGITYVASEPGLESSPDAIRLSLLALGGLDVHVGYCSGRNSTLNGLEFHKCSEVVFAGDPLLRKRNKWILAHPERRVLVEQGVAATLRGPNLALIPPAEAR